MADLGGEWFKLMLKDVFAKLVVGLTLATGGFGVKYLAQISSDLSDLKSISIYAVDKIRDHDQKLENHDRRIEKLETKVFRGSN